MIPFQLSTGSGLYIVTIPGVGQLPAENHYEEGRKYLGVVNQLMVYYLELYDVFAKSKWHDIIYR